MKGHTYSKRNKAFTEANAHGVFDRHVEQLVRNIAPFISANKNPKAVAKKPTKGVLPRGPAARRMMRLKRG